MMSWLTSLNLLAYVYEAQHVGVIALEIALLFIGTLLALWIRKYLLKGIFFFIRFKHQAKKTMYSLCISVTRYLFWICSIIYMLHLAGVELAPIIAATSILGAIVALGAKNMLSDLIAGFFIIVEDTYNVGDYISINEGKLVGTVEELGLHVTKVREFNGQLNTIGNSSITSVKNYNRSYMRVLLPIHIMYEVDMNRAKQVIQDICDDLKVRLSDFFLLENDEPKELPQLYSISKESIQQNDVIYTVKFVVKADNYWDAKNTAHEVVLSHLQKNGLIYTPVMIVKSSSDQREALED